MRIKAIIEKQRQESGITDPKIWKSEYISLVGKDVYEKLIRDIRKSGAEVPKTSKHLL